MLFQNLKGESFNKVHRFVSRKDLPSSGLPLKTGSILKSEQNPFRALLLQTAGNAQENSGVMGQSVAVPMKTVQGNSGGAQSQPLTNVYVEVSFADQQSYTSLISSPVSNGLSQSSRAQTPKQLSSKRHLSKRPTLGQKVELMQLQVPPAAAFERNFCHRPPEQPQS